MPSPLLENPFENSFESIATIYTYKLIQLDLFGNVLVGHSIYLICISHELLIMWTIHIPTFSPGFMRLLLLNRLDFHSSYYIHAECIAIATRATKNANLSFNRIIYGIIKSLLYYKERQQITNFIAR